ncbi:MAG: hypothetical protein KatS3mg110_0712 [Pirellulaceae bacterium]|nr:MAG: hypothetical protein KatS3mg110_0712 [Pirellulaceae bacterium]
MLALDATAVVLLSVIRPPQLVKAHNLEGSIALGVSPQLWSQHAATLCFRFSCVLASWAMLSEATIRHDCPHCVGLVDALRRAQSENDHGPGSRTAIVEVPPYGWNAAMGESSRWIHGRLLDRFRWYVETPVIVELTDGKVEAVRKRL